MNLELILFYLFSTLTIFSSIIVISLRNAVHSVLFLILTFCNTIMLFLLIGSEFLAFLFFIVYVGAIAVLFLFVIMMLNVKLISYKTNIWSITIIGFILLFNFFLQINFILNNMFELSEKVTRLPSWNNWFMQFDILNNVQAIGNVLYTKYSLLFIMCGFILFIAMIGVIVLTMHQRSNLHKQCINVQLQRVPSYSIKFINLKK